MTVFFFWLLFSIAVGIMASNKGRSGFGWFLLSCLISPLLGLLFCAVSKDLTKQAVSVAEQPGPDTHVKCPACAEWVMPEAKVCKHCGHALAHNFEFFDRQSRIRQAEREAKSQSGIITALLSGLVIFGVIYLIAR